MIRSTRHHLLDTNLNKLKSYERFLIAHIVLNGVISVGKSASRIGKTSFTAAKTAVTFVTPILTPR